MTNDCHVQGDLRVQGNLYVEGDITCNGSTGITVPRGDVVVAGTVGGTVVSLQEVEDALNSLDRSALVVTVTPEDEED